MQVSRLFCSPLQRAQASAQLVSTYQELAGSSKPHLEILPELTNRDWGEWEGKYAAEVHATLAPTPDRG